MRVSEILCLTVSRAMLEEISGDFQASKWKGNGPMVIESIGLSSTFYN